MASTTGKPKGDKKTHMERDTLWAENYEKEKDLVTLDQAGLKNVVFITNSNNTSFVVKGKVKSVVIDNCNKCKVQVEDILSNVEIINAKSITLYCTG